jgi:hypothetical protein
VRLSAEGRCDESLQTRHADEPPTALKRATPFQDVVAVLDDRRLLAIFRIEFGAGSWKVGERSAQDLNISDQKGTVSCSTFEPNNLWF